MIPTKHNGKPYKLILPKNRREAIVAQEMYNQGWVVLKNGLPDLFCFNPKTKEFKFIEVKALSQKYRTKKGIRLGRTQEQIRMHQYLEKIGMKVELRHVE